MCESLHIAVSAISANDATPAVPLKALGREQPDHQRAGLVFRVGDTRTDPSHSTRPRLRGLAQKSQAGLDARITLEATNINTFRQPLPLVVSNQRVEDLLQGHAMQWVVIVSGHGGPLNVVREKLLRGAHLSRGRLLMNSVWRPAGHQTVQRGSVT